MSSPSPIASRVDQLRKEQGYTLGQLARKCNVSAETLRNFKFGYHNPYKETIDKIMDGLGVTLDEFMRGVIIE